MVEHSLGGEDTVVLRFFEDGDAAKIGISEEKARVAACEAAALLRKYGADRRIIAWPIRIMSMRETHRRMSEWTRSRSWRMASFQ